MYRTKLSKSSNFLFPCPLAIGEIKKGSPESLIMVEDDNYMLMTPKEGKDIIHDLEVLIQSIGLIGNYRVTQRKECQSLVRRVKLLCLILEEIKETNPPLVGSTHASLCNLRRALLPSKKLLRTCAEGSKIYLALECEAITNMFHAVNAKLSQALDDIPYEDLMISDEVKEQIELMGAQLKRAKRRTDTQDMELAMDMMVVFNKEDDRNADIAMIERLAKKLELHTTEDLKAETNAVKRLAKDKRVEENLENIVDVLNKFKQIAGLEETNVLDDSPTYKAPVSIKSPNTEIPQEFLCPITLEIMTDPVIVATGQTYERESIQKWLDSNRRTCPKTGQTLAHLSLAPNYALKALIMQWCEKKKIQVSKKSTKESHLHGTHEASSCPEQMGKVIALIEDLSSNNVETQKEAAHKIRLLSKENPENRILIAEQDGIPPLVQLLKYSSDQKLKEHAVTALLNLSIDGTNKRLITEEDAIPGIIDALRRGSVGAKENAAATLFSLSMLDENKVTIGLSDGIPALVDLLASGTVRGKRDAATALFNLSLNYMNKERAIEAGIVNPLLSLLDDTELGMIDEALSILLLLVSHPLGRQQIGQLCFIQTLVQIMGDEVDSTPKNREGAAAILYELALNGGSSFLLAALQFGVYEALVDITQSGTNRAQRKAYSILQLMRQYEQIP